MNMQPIKLSEWSKQNNMSYYKAYDWYKKGKLPVPAFKNEGGSIMVGNKVDLSNVKISNASTENFLVQPKSLSLDGKPLETSLATSTRTNRSAFIEPLSRFANIDQVLIPFRHSPYATNTSTISVRDILVLCKKAYFGYSIVRNVINTFAHFCASKIYFTDGSQTSREFFDAYFKKIKLESFTLQFFKEFWLSHNCFIYKQLGTLKDEDVNNLRKVFGSKTTQAKSYKIPIKYVILNPVDIEARGASSLVSPQYLQVLSSYELDMLRNPRTEIDKEVFDSLNQDIQDKIKNGKSGAIYLELDPQLVRPVFNGKMDYEAFAVPMIYSLLDTLEAKTQLMKMDQAIARTCQQAILLITHGMETKNGEYMYSQKTTDALETIFQNESVGRVLICDFTTKAEFILPQIGEILDPKKYNVIQQDLQEGLGHILFGGGSSGEKFANQHAKIQIFIETLRSAREIFLNDFLIDEIKQISQTLGFKNYPIPHFEEIDLDDSNEFKRIVTQLAQIGFLTPSEVFQALETKRLPTEEESLEAQTKYRDNRDNGLYEPVVGGPFSNQKTAEISQKPVEGPVGRPPGSKSPKGVNTVNPIGTGSFFSLSKIKDNLVKSISLSQNIELKLKKKHKIKELSSNQKSFIDELSNIIIAHESPESWDKKIDDYLSGTLKENNNTIQKIKKISEEYNVDKFLAGILLHSTK